MLRYKKKFWISLLFIIILVLFVSCGRGNEYCGYWVQVLPPYGDSEEYGGANWVYLDVYDGDFSNKRGYGHIGYNRSDEAIIIDIDGDDLVTITDNNGNMLAHGRLNSTEGGWLKIDLDVNWIFSEEYVYKIGEGDNEILQVWFKFTERSGILEAPDDMYRE